MRPPSPSIPEKEFLFSALKQSLRLDGRLPLEMRSPTITFGPDLGWVECALGKTRYVEIAVVSLKWWPKRDYAAGFLLRWKRKW